MPCPICGIETLEGIPLSNGNILHDACYRSMTTRLSELSFQIDSLSKSKKILELKLNKSSGFFESILRTIFGGDSPESISSELKSTEKLLESISSDYLKLKISITNIYDLWTSYPPDWDKRVFEIKKLYFGCCSQCGSYKNLHVHHKIPLGRGGSNNIENLILLCENCHKKAHNTDSFIDKNFSQAFGEKIKKISYAIDKKRNIQFLYKKPTDSNYGKRIITPNRLKQVAHRKTNGNTLCVEAFCYTRNENRTFALKRMKNLTIL